MRVIAGTAGGRRLRAPAGISTRPITDRAKEAIFNMLEAHGGVVDKRVADLYAGSGSFGIESISRGAAEVIFVERDPKAMAVLKENLDSLGFRAKARLMSTGVEQAIDQLGQLDLVFLDPPYASDPWDWILGRLDADLLVAHDDQEIDLPVSWRELRRRRYGRAHIVIGARDRVL